MDSNPTIRDYAKSRSRPFRVKTGKQKFYRQKTFMIGTIKLSTCFGIK